jgi:hypothetical protein
VGKRPDSSDFANRFGLYQRFWMSKKWFRIHGFLSIEVIENLYLPLNK